MSVVLIAALMLLLANEINRSNRATDNAGRLRFENRDLHAKVERLTEEAAFYADLALEPSASVWERIEAEIAPERAAARYGNVVSLSAVRASHGGSAA